MTRRSHLLSPLAAYVVLSVCLSVSAESDPFAVPQILRDNVAFWKKIYTQVSLTEGLLHDNEYPLVIYDTVAIGKSTGRARRNKIRRARVRVEAALAALADTSGTAELGAFERHIGGLFREHASLEALESAESRIRFQQGQRERFLEGLRRSGMYLTTGPGRGHG